MNPAQAGLDADAEMGDARHVKAVLFIPSEEALDRSLDAQKYVNKLEHQLELERRFYDAPLENGAVEEDVASVAVMAGLSSLELESGYVEMEIDTIFEPQEIVRKLRTILPDNVPIVAIVDDAYSDYMLVTYLKAGASAVVGTSGGLFGMVLSRASERDRIWPYANVLSKL